MQKLFVNRFRILDYKTTTCPQLRNRPIKFNRQSRGTGDFILVLNFKTFFSCQHILMALILNKCNICINCKNQSKIYLQE